MEWYWLSIGVFRSQSGPPNGTSRSATDFEKWLKEKKITLVPLLKQPKLFSYSFFYGC